MVARVLALPAEGYEKMKLNVLRAELVIGDAQADRGEFIEYRLGDLLKKMALDRTN